MATIPTLSPDATMPIPAPLFERIGGAPALPRNMSSADPGARGTAS